MIWRTASIGLTMVMISHCKWWFSQNLSDLPFDWQFLWFRCCQTTESLSVVFYSGVTNRASVVANTDGRKSHQFMTLFDESRLASSEPLVAASASKRNCHNRLGHHANIKESAHRRGMNEWGLEVCEVFDATLLVALIFPVRPFIAIVGIEKINEMFCVI